MYGFNVNEDSDSYFGFRNTLLAPNEDQSGWKLSIHGNEHIFAILVRKKSPIGFHSWTIFNDTCEDEPSTYQTVLNFNSCNSTEYSCKDGSWFVHFQCK